MTFWDFCAPFYDLAEKFNDRAYKEMLETVRRLVPQGASVLEVAAGTGAISLAVADKAASVLCTDISEQMLAVARKKAARRNTKNISFGNVNIFDLDKPDNSFDVVVASQVFHLIDRPEIAAKNLRRVAKNMVILPMSYTKNLRGYAKLGVNVYRLLGFAPKIEFDEKAFAAFLPEIGFADCEILQIPGTIPMAVAIWKK